MNTDFESFLITVDGLHVTKSKGPIPGLRKIKSFQTGMGAFNYYEGHMSRNVQNESAIKIKKVRWRTEDSEYEPGPDETRAYVLAADDHEGNTKIVYQWKKQTNPFFSCKIEFIGDHSATLTDLDTRIYDDLSKAEKKIGRLEDLNDLLRKRALEIAEEARHSGIDLARIKRELRRGGWDPVRDGTQDPRYKKALDFAKQKQQDRIDKWVKEAEQIEKRAFHVRSIVIKKIQDFSVDLLRALN